MAIEIDSLEIEISASAQSAAGHIQKLTESLEALRKVTNKKFGDITGAFDKIRSFADTSTLGNISEAAEKIQHLANALSGLKDAVGGKLGGVAKEIQAISKAASTDIAKGALESAKSATQKIPLTETTTGISQEVKLDVDGITQANNATQDLTKSTEALINEALHAPDAVNQLKMLTSQITALRDELYKGAREGTLSKEQIDKNVSQIQTLFNKGFALRLPEGTVPDFEELRYTISNMKDFQGEISGFINQLSADEAKLRRIGAEISLTFEKMGQEMRRSGVSIADPSMAKYVDKIAELRDKYNELNQSIRRFKESVSTDFSASIDKSLALPDVISNMQRLEAEMISVRRSLVEGGRDGTQTSKEWEDGIKRIRRAYDEFERIKIPDSVLANSEYVSQIEAITERVKRLANVQGDSKEAAQLFRAELENTVSTATAEELKLRSLASQIQTLYDTIAKARAEGASADDPIVTKGSAKLKSLYEQYDAIEEKIQNAARRSGVDFAASVEKSLDTPKVINDMKLIEEQIYAVQNALIESSNSGKSSGEAFYKSIQKIQSAYEKFQAIKIPDSVLANPEYATEIQEITERINNLVRAKGIDTTATQAATAATRDFYGDIERLVSGTTQEEVQLHILSAEIENAKNKLNEMLQSGNADGAGMWKQVQVIQRLQEEYEKLNPAPMRVIPEAVEQVLLSINELSSGILRNESVWKDFGNAIAEDFTGVKRTFAGVVAAVTIQVEVIKSKLSDAINSIKSFAGNDLTRYIGATIAQPFALIGKGISGALLGVSKLLSPLKSALSSDMPEAVNMANAATDSLIQKLSGALLGAVKQAANAVLQLTKNIVTTPYVRVGNLVTGFVKKLTGLYAAVKRIIFYRTIRRAIQVLTQSITAGIQNLYQYSRLVDTSFHSAMDSIATDILYIKNSVGSVAGIIVETLAPAIDMIAGKFASVAATTAEFLAGITGRTTFSRAKKQAASYADTIGGISDAAKQAKQNLIGIDELTILGDKGLTQDYSTMFEEVPVSNNMMEAITKLKDSLSGIPQVITTAWEMTGLDMVDAWKDALKSVLDLLGTIRETFVTVFTDGHGVKLLNSIFDLFKEIADIIGAIADAFKKAWDDGEQGRKYVESIFEMFTKVNNLLIGIGKTFESAWSSGIGEEIAGKILHIFEGIHDVIGNIAEGIRKAWEDTGLGEEIWKTILTIVDDVLGAVDRMVQATVEWSKKLDFEPLFSAADRALKALEPLVKLISDGLAWAWENVLLPFGKWTIEEAMPVVLDTLATVFETLKKVLEALQPFAMEIWEDFLKPLGKWSGEVFIAAFKDINDLLERFGKLISGEIKFSEFLENLSAFQNLLISIGMAFATYKIIPLLEGFNVAIRKPIGAEGGLSVLAASILGVADALLVMYDIVEISKAAKEWEDLNDSHYHATQQYISNITKAYELGGQEALDKITGSNISLEEAIKEAEKRYEEMPHNMFEGFAAGWGDYFGKDGKGLWQLVKDAFQHFLDNTLSFFGIHSPSTVFADIGENLVLGLQEGLTDKWEDITTFFSDKWSSLKQGFSDTWEGIRTTAGTAWEGITTTLGGLWEGVKTTANKKFEKIKQNVTGIWGDLRTDTATATQEISASTQTAWTDVQRETIEKWRDVKTAIADAVREIRQSPEAFTSFSKIVNGAFGSIKTAATEAFAIVKSDITQIAILIGNKVSDIGQALSTITGKVSDSFSRVQNTLKNIADRVSDTVSASVNSLASIPTHAEGGYGISSGQLFIAREAGPELVGQIGNQNAVANNAQIVEGIASGVSEANEEVVNAIYVGIARVIETIEESRNSGGNLDYRRLSQLITQQQYRTAKMNP